MISNILSNFINIIDSNSYSHSHHLRGSSSISSILSSSRSLSSVISISISTISSLSSLSTSTLTYIKRRLDSEDSVAFVSTQV